MSFMVILSVGWSARKLALVPPVSFRFAQGFHNGAEIVAGGSEHGRLHWQQLHSRQGSEGPTGAKFGDCAVET